MKKFESKQYLPREERPDEEIPEGIEVPEEEWELLKIIAQRVGGDFDMIVRLGRPGEGSYFDPEDCSITIDPLHIRENPDLAKFVTAHEGGHRAITLNPRDFGLFEREINELYSQIGFASLQNFIEDPAVNDWIEERFPGLKPHIKKIYDEQLREEGVVLSTPEVQIIARQLGYWPRFAQFGSEVIRDWHQKRFSRRLDPAVEKALQRTIEYARRSIRSIPDPQKSPLSREEIIEAARERFRTNTYYIWPEVRKLVEMDLRTEEQRQMMKDIRQKLKELEEKRKELERAKAQGDEEKQKELQREIEELEKELDPFNRLPEDIRKELQEQIDKAIREATEQLSREIEERQKQIEEANQRQKQLEEEIEDLENKIKDLRKKAKQASSPEREELERQIQELEKQIQEKKIEKLSHEMRQKQAEEEIKDIQDTLSKIQSGEEMPYPEDRLSEETKQALEQLFQKLPKPKREEYRKKAKEKLEDFEDAINEGLSGKLNRDKPESHKERREREKREKEREEKRRRIEEERTRLEEKLEEMFREKMTEYDKIYSEVVDIINSLYNRLREIFSKKSQLKWRTGYPSGQRIDLRMAMQAEADPRYSDRIWERKTIPHEFDYRFCVLVDLSGSMQGEKIEETFKGIVVLAEVFEKLRIQYEIIGFSDDVKIFKEWRSKLDKRLRNELVEMKSWGGGGTDTTNATQIAYERLLENLGKDNFLITLTDGQPNEPETLKEILSRIRKEGKIKLVGIGLGPETEFVKEYYPAALSLPTLRPTQEQIRQGQKDFSEAFAELLEDMIINPQKY